MAPPALDIHPPLLNSASPWATTSEQITQLLASSSTGAVTVRTSLIAGFDHQPSQHRFVFFDPSSSQPDTSGTHSYPDGKDGASAAGEGAEGFGTIGTDIERPASLNNLGYSPITLHDYLEMLEKIGQGVPIDQHRKTVILSVTGTQGEINDCYTSIIAAQEKIAFPLAMEVNLSCPNIPGAPPVAYDVKSLADYLSALQADPAIPVGIKTPPYTHAGQYEALKSALQSSKAESRLSFITATNTLGSCVVLDQDAQGPVLPGTAGLGGMAGPPLHPLALGNVATIRKLLDEDGDGVELGHIAIIGVGGVGDGQGYKRMRSAGASAVGLATGLGVEGPSVFSKIEKQIGSTW